MNVQTQRAPAPDPYDWQTSGKPGGNGDFNVYLIDRDGRKIAAVWGKRGEKESTVALLAAAPAMRDALKAAQTYKADMDPATRKLIAFALRKAEEAAFL